MAKKFIVSIVAMIAIIGLVVAGCPTEIPEPPPPPPPPEEREGGAWVDEIVISQESDHAAAVLKLQEGTIAVYGHGLTDTDLFAAVADDPDLDYQLTLGGSRDFLFNVTGPEFADGRLNPFYSAKIREAMNWLIDRDYIAEEILGGMGVPLYTQFGPGGAEATRYKDLVDEVIAYYSYDPVKAEAQVTEAMLELGAELVDGKWQYEGEPVVIKQAIRIDLRPYPELGDYLADQIEGLGFTVERLYRASADTWTGALLLGPPAEGNWNIYGGGWGMPAVFRTEVHSFRQFNTHEVNTWGPPWTVLEPLMEEWPEMYEGCIDLAFTNFNTMEERAALVETVLWEVMRFSNSIWSIAITDFIPHRADVGMSLDAAGGVSSQFPFTIHFKDGAGNPVRGGTLHMELPSILVNAMNPVDGSAFTYDIMIQRDLTGDMGLMPHPQTGLNMPQRIERADVTIKEGLPVGISPESDWCTLSFAPEIQVPLTAWADWDAVNQQFVTVAERMVYDEDYRPFANRKSVVYYPEDMWDWKMHDGSTFSMGDFLMSFIVGWDRGKVDSPIFDESEKGAVETALKRWKGIEILNTDPLTVAFYSDAYALDAEHSITTFFPGYGTYGEFAPWHTIAVGMLAEMNSQLTFSQGKADELGVEWMDYTKGPSLAILKARLDQAKAEGFIPYAPTLGEYITAAEAAERYDNLLAWHADKGHFYVSCGAFYLEEVFPIGKIAVLKAFDHYPFASEKWMFLVP